MGGRYTTTRWRHIDSETTTTWEAAPLPRVCGTLTTRPPPHGRPLHQLALVEHEPNSVKLFRGSLGGLTYSLCVGVYLVKLFVRIKGSISRQNSWLCLAVASYCECTGYRLLS